MEVHPVGADLRRTDGHDEANIRFRNVAKAPNHHENSALPVFF